MMLLLSNCPFKPAVETHRQPAKSHDSNICNTAGLLEKTNLPAIPHGSACGWEAAPVCSDEFEDRGDHASEYVGEDASGDCSDGKWPNPHFAVHLHSLSHDPARRGSDRTLKLRPVIVNISWHNPDIIRRAQCSLWYFADFIIEPSDGQQSNDSIQPRRWKPSMPHHPTVAISLPQRD
jgi:hypothetical protein